REIRARHLRAAAEQVQRLPDGPQGADEGPYLLRRRGHRDAGRLAAGEHGRDPGPHAREPLPNGSRHRAGAQETAGRGKSEQGRQAHPWVAARRAARALLRDRAAARAALSRARAPWPVPAARHRSGDGLVPSPSMAADKPPKGTESQYHGKKDRVFVRGMQGHYNLREELARLRAVPRVRKGKNIKFIDGPQAYSRHYVEPKDG